MSFDQCCEAARELKVEHEQTRDIIEKEEKKDQEVVAASNFSSELCVSALSSSEEITSKKSLECSSTEISNVKATFPITSKGFLWWSSSKTRSNPKLTHCSHAPQCLICKPIPPPFGWSTLEQYTAIQISILGTLSNTSDTEWIKDKMGLYSIQCILTDWWNMWNMSVTDLLWFK